MSEFRKRLAGKLSGGMKQKLGLVCALIHRPKVILLDEPTTGVDPVSRRDFWKILYNLVSEGVAILTSTAYLDEAERCHRVALLHQGKLLFCDTPANLKSRLGKGVLAITAPRSARATQCSERCSRRHLEHGPDRRWRARCGRRRRRAACQSSNHGLQAAECRSISFAPSLPSIEDLFVDAVTGGTGRRCMNDRRQLGHRSRSREALRRLRRGRSH